jgi:sugar (pentulose or hexulose) kinase
MKIPVILIFDVGKTNKKVLLFDEQYRLVYEQSQTLAETTDEDGFACEDVALLTLWVTQKFDEIMANPAYKVSAVNFSGYGASFVYVDEQLKPVAPLYNYLKPYPQQLQQQLYSAWGGESALSKQTASPVLGSLNSGMQLYRIKYQQPQVFARIKYCLHLPQYLAAVISGQPFADITSVGCHTMLWDYRDSQYHAWVKAEGLPTLLPPILAGNKTVAIPGSGIPCGAGLHDSSAALVPYLAGFKQPFLLLSTGTWCISLNPFNHSLLSDYELHHDCLCYLTYQAKPVKASRLFAGYEHEQQVKRLAAHFNKPNDYYKTVQYDPALSNAAVAKPLTANQAVMGQSGFGQMDLQIFESYEQAYHTLISLIINQQAVSTNLVLSGTPVQQLFVDGGFGSNSIYMHMLARVMPGIKIYAAEVGQASALGAALAIHESWNTLPVPEDIIRLREYHA